MKKFLALILALTLMLATSVPAYAVGLDAPIDTVIDYGWVIFAALVCAVVLIIAVARFAKTPRKEQLAKVKEWLLLAVMKAEKKFGEDTGVLKLRVVYDLFVTKFPWIAKVLTFDRFSELVDEALGEMRKLLEANPAILDEVANIE